MDTFSTPFSGAHDRMRSAIQTDRQFICFRYCALAALFLSCQRSESEGHQKRNISLLRKKSWTSMPPIDSQRTDTISSCESLEDSVSEDMTSGWKFQFRRIVQRPAKQDFWASRVQKHNRCRQLYLRSSELENYNGTIHCNEKNDFRTNFLSGRHFDRNR